MMQYWENEQQLILWIVGLILMFIGAGLFHVVTKITGVFVGAVSGMIVGLLCSVFMDLGSKDIATYAVMGVFIIAGVFIGHFFFNFGLRVTFAVAGLLSGLILGALGCEILCPPPFEWTGRMGLIVAGCAVLGAVLCAFFQRWAVIVFCAAAGSALTVYGMPELRGRWLLWGVGLFAASFVWQGLFVKLLFRSHDKED